MSLPSAPSSDQARALDFERIPSPTKWMVRAGIWTLLVLFGIGTGVGLTLVTVVWPRRTELSRVHPPSPFYSGFDPSSILKRVAPDTEWKQDVREDTPMTGPRAWARWFVVQGKVPPEKAETVVRLFDTQLSTPMGSTPGTPLPSTYFWSQTQQDHAETGYRWREQSMNYRCGETEGSMHIITVIKDGNILIQIGVIEP